MQKSLSWSHWIFILVCGLVALSFYQVSAQEEPPAWQKNLDCPDSLQKFKGIEYCQSKSDLPFKVHVLVIDLYDKSPRFEYIIVEGKDRDGIFGECRDVNIPTWSKGPGCSDPNNLMLYPVMPFTSAVDRAQDKGAVALINGDYSACTNSKADCERRGLQYRSHGPEGLTVVAGNRRDGRDVGDTDNNVVNRPWLAIAKEYAFHADIFTEKLRAEIHQAKSDSGGLPYEWIWTGMGGAPWLVRNGEVKEKEIKACTGASGSCYAGASQTAVGLTKDGRWMFLVLGDKPTTLLDLANFMDQKLEVEQAIKLDGGGSTQFWYSGSDQPFIMEGDKRQLTNYLAVIADPGNGIDIKQPPPNMPGPSPSPTPPAGSDPFGSLPDWITNTGIYKWFISIYQQGKDLWNQIVQAQKDWEEFQKNMQDPEWVAEKLLTWLVQTCCPGLIPAGIAVLFITYRKRKI